MPEEPRLGDEYAMFGKMAAAIPAGAAATPGARQSADRLAVVALAFVLAFTVLSGRLIQLAVFGTDKVGAGHAGYVAPAPRAEILDRNGHLLATNLTVASVYADPDSVWDVHEAVAKLCAIFPDLDPGKLAERLTAKGRWSWIKREVTPAEAERVRHLGLPGVFLTDERRRAYLQGPLFAHILGGVDTDNRGTAGIEKALDARLADETQGPLVTSLDLSVQHALRDELVSATDRLHAKGAAGIIMDVNNGELLALVSLPDFDPNIPGDPDDPDRLNRATLGVYEMGSTFKILNTAMALDSGKVTLKSGYDASHPIHIGRFTIHDYHPENRWLSVPEIFLHSSNIGSAKMAVDVGTEIQKAFMKKVGILDRPAVELTEVGRPLYPAEWHEINTMTIAFGHGISVSPLALAKAVAPTINGGYLVEPTLRKEDPGSAPARHRVISPATSRIMRALMRAVVLKGTGTKADVPGYDIGGKTGTADKPDGHGYNKKHSVMASFVAIFPAQAPRYLVLVMIDEPQGTSETRGFVTAGWTAAPTAGEVIKRVAPILRVSPVWDSSKTVLASNN